MSKLDLLINESGKNIPSVCEDAKLELSFLRAELAALRARVAELERPRTVGEGLAMLSASENDARLLELERVVENLKLQLVPKTCATCKWFRGRGHFGVDCCESDKSPFVDFTHAKPDAFGCIHHEAL